MLSICCKNLLGFFFIFFFITDSLSENLNPFCESKNFDFQKENFITYNQNQINFNEIQISIKLKNYRKWIENSIEAFTTIDVKNINSDEVLQLGQSFLIDEKYKKNFPAVVDISFNNKLSCKFDAKVKIHGDLGDHLSPTNNQTSIKVKLLNGNIYGIEEFILFRPQSRNGLNEVYINLFMREMGFLAPQTAKMNVEINGDFNDFIFQERINKNFLERNSLRESIIIKMDDREYSQKHIENFNLPISRIHNVKWALSNYDNYTLALNALAEISKIELINNGIEFYDLGVGNSAFLPISLYNNKDLFHENYLFELSTIIFDGGHALGKHNRIFYYDFYQNKFFSILYDSQPKIFSIKKFKLKDLVNEHTWSTYFDLSERHLKEKNEFIKRFSKIKKNTEILNKLNNVGIKIDNKKLINIYDLIDQRLKNIHLQKNIDENDYYSSIERLLKKNILYNFNNPIKKNFNLTYKDFNNEIFVKCKESYNINCSKKNIKELFLNNNSGEIKKQKFFTDKNNFFIGDKEILKNPIKYMNRSINLFNKSFESSDGKINFLYNNIKFEIVEKEKKLNFTDNFEKIVFLNSEIDNWSIKYINSSQNNSSNFKNTKFITGCINIVNSKLKDLNITIHNAGCEDAINIVGSTGSLNEIKINNSSSDAIDLDFSDIKIESLDINNSSNDCFDVSFGNYSIEKANLVGCGDKGISVGENSLFDGNEIVIKNSKVGVATKDSSISNLNNILMNNIEKFCLAAYRKKNEFVGSYMSIKTLNGECDNKLLEQQGSKIVR
jgi:hypothetical protein